MITRNDVIGKRFGRLTIIDAPETVYGISEVVCKCDCGTVKSLKYSHLTNNHTRSCGCLKNELSSQRLKKQNYKHGDSKTRLYGIFLDIHKRCENPKMWAYDRYGGRGVTVCEEWSNFPCFKEWAIANGYADDLTIDRINNDEGYSPSNCRWVNRKVQGNNKSNNVRYEYKGEMYTASELSDISGIKYHTIIGRLTKGWSVAKAVETPVRILRKGGDHTRNSETIKKICT